MSLRLVTGTRHGTIDEHGLFVRQILLKTLDGDGPHTIYVGDEPDGVDAIVTSIARREGWTPRVFEAAWEECGVGCPPSEHRRRRRRTGEIYCPWAGPRRNNGMVRQYVADGGRDVIGFPAANARSSGTNGCLRRARAAGLHVESFPLTVEVRR